MVKGARDEFHPNRRVSSGDFGPGGNYFGGGDFPSPTPTSPPLSEQPGKGIHSQGEYHELGGNTGRFINPEGTMTVGVSHSPTSPPLSEQPGRGVFGVNAASQFFQENQPTTFEPGFGGPVMADYLNNSQFTPS